MGALPILVIAVVQGVLLYGLHLSLDHKVWPATDSMWLLAFYAVALFVPVALELFAARLRERFTWAVAAAIALVAGGLGGYAGWVVDVPRYERFDFEFVFPLYSALLAAWFIALPFAQAGARRGTWKVQYPDLFEFSWQNALQLAEAALFTGVFWILLFLWGALFRVVDITFFAELFSKPAFVYPVTSIAFGYAIYLIESHERIVVTLRRHLLGVFSWLLPLVATIAVLFLLVLPFTGLAPLWKTGHASTLMLWLQVLFVHFLNCAYEDGQSEPRYPGWLRLVLRVAVFALPVYGALCAYSLGLRVEQHGWTVSRVWAGIATFLAALYGLAYAFAALKGTPWLGRLAKINVGLAAATAGVLLLATSPLLDPKRVSAASQMERLRSGAVNGPRFDYEYLRFRLGRFGKNALAELAAGPDNEVAALAKAALAKTSRYAQSNVAPEQIASRFRLFPENAVLDPAFLEYLKGAVGERTFEHPSCLWRLNENPCLMLALDLNGDGNPEILVFGSASQVLYGKVGGRWKKIGNLLAPHQARVDIEAAMAKSQVRIEPVEWPDISVGGVRYTLNRAP